MWEAIHAIHWTVREATGTTIPTCTKLHLPRKLIQETSIAMRGATGITLRHHQILDLRHYKNGQRKNQTANVIDAAFPIGSIAADAKE